MYRILLSIIFISIVCKIRFDFLFIFKIAYYNYFQLQDYVYLKKACDNKRVQF